MALTLLNVYVQVQAPFLQKKNHQWFFQVGGGVRDLLLHWGTHPSSVILDMCISWGWQLMDNQLQFVEFKLSIAKCLWGCRSHAMSYTVLQYLPAEANQIKKTLGDERFARPGWYNGT